MFEDLYDCYRMLEVEPGASLDEVKRSYRELVKVWHPDRFSHDPKLREKAVEKLKKINSAYERVCEVGDTLRYTPPPAGEREQSRQQRRARHEERGYERARARQHAAPEPPPPPPPPPPPRQRETWMRRARSGAPVGGVFISLLLIYVFYPEPEPRFLIELPPEPPPAAAPAAAPAAQPGGVKRARPAPAATFKLPDPKLFGIGSTKAEVIEAQGNPDRATDTLFVYGTSDVFFENGKVKSWRNGFPRLKVKMFATANLGGKEYFTVGSTKDQVIHAQGTPDSLTETSFTYGTSKVYFENGKVKSWQIRYTPLNARLPPKSGVGERTHFTVGSTRDEVLAAQGTPDAFTESEFSYGTSRVYFEKGRVQSWQSGSPKLNARSPTG